jgi:four helix bundle protein
VGSKNFRQLIVWQRADEVRHLVYDAAERFPSEQKFELARQMREAAHSITPNIAEGFGRWKPKDKANFHIFAKGSAEELSDGTVFAHQRGYGPDIAVVSSKLDEGERMLRVLIRKTTGMGSG